MEFHIFDVKIIDNRQSFFHYIISFKENSLIELWKMKSDKLKKNEKKGV